MIKAAVARTPILVLILMFMAVGYTIAHNKVVIVPMGVDAGVSGYEVVNSSRALLGISAQNTTYSHQAECPQGKKVLGGGVRAGSAYFVTSTSSPVEDVQSSRWVGGVSLKGGQSNRSTTFTVYAICANTIN